MTDNSKNLMTSANKKDSFLKQNDINMWSGLTAGIANGLSSYFGAKAQANTNIANAYYQAIPQYQMIQSQSQQLQSQQAIAYFNNGVDITKGTASQVIQRTGEQAAMKIQEIRDNLSAYASNQKKMGSANAVSGLIGGISQGFGAVATATMNEITYNAQYKKNDSNNLMGGK
jgi:hypothetical protein